MKKTAYKLSIENPCHKKDWHTMKDVDKGKFCSVCSKNVMDFATWQDKEIIAYLNNTDASICGRLNHSQLNRIIAINKPSEIKYWHKLVASLVVLTTASNLDATNNIVNKPISQQQENSNSKKLPYRTVAINDSIKNVIKGILIEESSNNPIANTEIVVKDTKLTTKTDALGNFEILIPQDYPHDNIVLLVIAGYGFEGQTEKTIAKADLPVTNLIIKKP